MNDNYERGSRNVNQRNYSETNSYGRGDQNQTKSYSRHNYETNSKPEYQRTNSSDLLTQSRNNLNRTRNGYGDREKVVRTELAPGIILEGVEVDL